MKMEGLSKIIAKEEKADSQILDGLYKGSELFETCMNEVIDLYHKGGLKTLSTGFYELDSKLGGGLYNGLYIVGAVSSLGKTTFIHQIADYIATNGTPVLFFSLEMSKNELISKSITREAYKLDKEFSIGAREFLNGTFSNKTLNILSKVKNVFENMYISEGTFNTTIEEIKLKANLLKEKLGIAPLIIVDYLQIITPKDLRMNDKQNADINVSELKRLSRDLETPVIAISSINRTSYLSQMSFESFKESGNIEFGADVVLGLQLSAIHNINLKKGNKEMSLDEKRKAYNAAKSKNPRDIEVVILKNRYGNPTGTHNYKYYPKFNLFEEEIDLEPVKIDDNDNLSDWINDGSLIV